MIEAAREGRSAALLVHGEAGMGKTTLLRDAADQAHGMRVLRARGIESESELPFAALSATYFAHIGFFNPYLPLWLKAQGLPIVTISLLASVQSFTRVFAPYAWGALSDHTGERVKLLRISATIALVASAELWITGGAWWMRGAST